MPKPSPTSPHLIADQITETELQAAVIELAKWHRWLVHHTRPAQTKDGWRTPIQGDAGFPDLILTRGGRLIIAELKRQGAKPTPSQQEWLDRCAEAPTVEVHVWRPSDWLSGEVLEILK